MGAKNRQRVIALVERIQETQQLLGRLESELDGLTLPDSEVPERLTVSQPPVRKTRLAKAEASLPERILDVMRRDPGRTFTSDDFRELESAGAPMPNIRVALVRLHNAGRLLKTGRGSYKLAPAEVA
jgi:hypothetical protein